MGGALFNKFEVQRITAPMVYGNERKTTGAGIKCRRCGLRKDPSCFEGEGPACLKCLAEMKGAEVRRGSHGR